MCLVLWEFMLPPLGINRSAVCLFPLGFACCYLWPLKLVSHVPGALKEVMPPPLALAGEPCSCSLCAVVLLPLAVQRVRREPEQQSKVWDCEIVSSIMWQSDFGIQLWCFLHPSCCGPSCVAVACLSNCNVGIKEVLLYPECVTALLLSDKKGGDIPPAPPTQLPPVCDSVSLSAPSECVTSSLRMRQLSHVLTPVFCCCRASWPGATMGTQRMLALQVFHW